MIKDNLNLYNQNKTLSIDIQTTSPSQETKSRLFTSSVKAKKIKIDKNRAHPPRMRPAVHTRVKTSTTRLNIRVQHTPAFHQALYMPTKKLNGPKIQQSAEPPHPRSTWAAHSKQHFIIHLGPVRH